MCMLIGIVGCARDIKPTEIYGLWKQNNSSPTNSYHWSNAKLEFLSNGGFIAENIPARVLMGEKGGISGVGTWRIERKDFQTILIQLNFEKIAGRKWGLDTDIRIGTFGKKLVLYFGGDVDPVFEFEKESRLKIK